MNQGNNQTQPTPFENRENSIPFTLQQVGSLPDEVNVDIKTVTGLFGISKSTVYRLVKSGKLKKYKISERTSRFNLGEVRAYLASLKGGVK